MDNEFSCCVVCGVEGGGWGVGCGEGVCGGMGLGGVCEFGEWYRGDIGG